MGIKRRAPKGGYDNPEKRKYRYKVWKHLRNKAIPILNKDDNAKVLMLPSKEGLEIDAAIKYGIKPEQIIAIDENPALLAHAKWKPKIPKKNRFGCKVSRVGNKIKDNGWTLACANLDLCNQISEELVYELNCFLETSPISNGFSFFVTFMKGRESKALYLLLKQRNSSELFNHARLSALYELINWPVIQNHYWSCDFEQTYVSNRAPMVYACFSSVNGKVTSDKIEEKARRLEILGNRMSYMDSCKTGRNGGYRDKSEKVGRIKESIETEARLLMNEIHDIKMDYAHNRKIIEIDQFCKDNEPMFYYNRKPHYSGFTFRNKKSNMDRFW